MTNSNSLKERLRGLSVLWLSLCGLAGPLAAQDVRGAGPIEAIELMIVDGLITVAVRDVAAQDVLDEIARQTRLTIVQDTPLEHRVSLDIERRALPAVLKRILGDRSYQLHVLPSESRESVAGEDRSGILWIFSANSSTRSSAAEFLESEVLHGDVRSRRAAVRSLQRLGSSEAVEPLSLALADEDRGVRIDAIDSLAAIGGDDARAALASATMDDDPWVRAEAANALASIGGDSSAQYLNLALEDSDPNVRASVIEAYGDLAGRRSVEVLSAALSDPDPSVRLLAVDLLEEMGGDAAFYALSRARSDPDADVQQAIDESIALLEQRR